MEQRLQMKIFQICWKNNQPSGPKRSMNLKQGKYKENHCERQNIAHHTAIRKITTFSFLETMKTPHGKRALSGVIKLRMLRWSDYTGLSGGWAMSSQTPL